MGRKFNITLFLYLNNLLINPLVITAVLPWDEFVDREVQNFTFLKISLGLSERYLKSMVFLAYFTFNLSRTELVWMSDTKPQSSLSSRGTLAGTADRSMRQLLSL